MVLEEQRIKRGVIRAARRRGAGRQRARSRATATGAATRPGACSRSPSASTRVQFGRAGLERHYNDALTGRKEELARIVDSLVEKDRVGDDLRTTLDPKAQKVANDALAGPQRRGRGARRQDRRGARAGRHAVVQPEPTRHAARPSTRATQGLYPPGSTMKTVTASAAIDSGRYQPDSRVSGRNGKVISGTPLNNFGSQGYRRHHAHGGADQLGQHRLGRSGRQARAQPDAGVHGPLRVHGGPADGLSRRADGRQRPRDPKTGALIPMSSDRVDVGRTAIGQALLLVTPLQMATVAQTIGNGGMRMQPRLVEKVIDPDGRTVEEPLPEEAERVMSRRQRGQGRDDDEVGRARGLGHRGGARGRRAGGQDRHGGDRHRPRASTTSGSSASPTTSRSP